jgi:integration host factor subunit beta
MKDPTVKTVTKRELLDGIAAATGYRRSDLASILQSVLDQIVAELRQGHRIEFRDFGVFEVRLRKARVGRNPHTNDPVSVDARTVVKFKAGRQMRMDVHAMGEAAARTSNRTKKTRAKSLTSKSQIEPKPIGQSSALRDALLRSPSKAVPRSDESPRGSRAKSKMSEVAEDHAS